MTLKPLIAGASLALALAGCAASNLELTDLSPSQIMALKKNEQKPNLEETILKQAEQSQTLILGEFHDVDADDYFAGDLLAKLKTRGYNHLGVELSYKNQPILDRFLEGEISDEQFSKETYGARKGFLYLLRKAKEAGIKVHAIDFHDYCYDGPNEIEGKVVNRDAQIYYNLEKKVFLDDPEAKVILFFGAWHAIEQPSSQECLPKSTGECRSEVGCGNPLGYFLSQATAGKNFSVFLDTYRAKFMSFQRKEDRRCDYPAWVGIKEGVDVDLVTNPPVKYLERDEMIDSPEKRGTEK